MLALSALLPLFASAASAAPALGARQGLDVCQQQFGSSGVATDMNFTLAALNSTLPNANSTGAPLVLGLTYDAGAQLYETLSTYESFPYNDWQTFSLQNGTLYPYDNQATYETAVALSVPAGEQLQFEISNGGIYDPSTATYCLLVGDAPSGHNPVYPILAVNGEAESFSLCMSSATDGPARGQNTVVYDAIDSGEGEYDYSTCYPVTLQAVQLEDLS